MKFEKILIKCTPGYMDMISVFTNLKNPIDLTEPLILTFMAKQGEGMLYVIKNFPGLPINEN